MAIARISTIALVILYICVEKLRIIARVITSNKYVLKVYLTTTR